MGAIGFINGYCARLAAHVKKNSCPISLAQMPQKQALGTSPGTIACTMGSMVFMMCSMRTWILNNGLGRVDEVNFFCNANFQNAQTSNPSILNSQIQEDMSIAPCEGGVKRGRKRPYENPLWIQVVWSSCCVLWWVR